MLIIFSVVLVSFTENETERKANIVLIMGDEIEAIEVKNTKETSSNLEEFLGAFKGSKSIDEEKIENINRVEKLVKWLEANRLPVKLEYSNSNSKQTPVVNILDTVFIKSPYKAEQCESTNEVILDRIRQLINQIPSEF